MTPAIDEGTRSRTNEALRQREALLHAVEAIADPLFVKDRDSRMVMANAATARAIGKPIEQIVGHTDAEFYDDPAIAKAMMANDRQVMETGQPLSIEELVPSRGGMRTYLSFKVPWRDADGRIIGVIGSARDITDQKRAEEALRESEARLRAFFEQAAVGTGVVDPITGRFLQANSKLCEITGYNLPELLGMGIWDITHPDDQPADRERYHRLVTGEAREYLADKRYVRKDGRIVWVHVALGMVRDKQDRAVRVVGVVQDITEQRQAQAALRDSEERLRAFFEQAAVGTAVANPATGQFTQANSKYCEITGYSLQELLNMGIWDVTHPDDRMVDYDRYHRLVTGEAKEYLADKRYVRKDGRVIWVHVAVGMVRDAQGRATQSVGVIQDITIQKHAEEALRESEAGLAAAQRIAKIGSWEWDIRDDTARWSDETFRIFGTTPGPLLPEHRESFVNMVHPDDRERVNQALTDALSGAREYNLEYRINFPESAEKIIHSQAEVVRSADGKPVMMRGTIHDVTERKRWEEQLRAAQAAAEQANRAKDQFIAALSHELRTPLTPVLAAASYLQADRRLPLDARDDLAVIHRNIDLETRLIDDLLDLTRIAQSKIDLQKRPVDLAHVLREAARICSAELDVRSQHLVIETPGEPYPMLADAARLHQLFWNLLKNAIKFSPEDSTIIIRAGREDAWITIEVADAGVGIDPQLLPRLFSPFEQGEQAITRRFGGLGLGLTICKSVAEMHGGSISARSGGPGKGATFAVRLPLAPELAVELMPAAHRAAQQPPEVAPSPAQPVRILLVEDHVDTSRMIARLLRSKGYEVGTAGTVSEALEAVKRGRFDVLLSDLGLPDGTGCDLVQKVAAQGQPIKGIALSGYGTTEDIERSLRAGFLAHLVKPVSFQTLQEALLSIAG